MKEKDYALICGSDPDEAYKKAVKFIQEQRDRWRMGAVWVYAQRLKDGDWYISYYQKVEKIFTPVAVT